jgi:ribose transport system substrate-binding protein
MRDTLSHAFCLFLVLTILPLAGCGGSASVEKKAEKDHKYVIGVSLTRTDDPRQTQLKADLEAAAAKHPDLALNIRICDNNAARQQGDLEGLQAQGVNAIIIRPVDPTASAAPVAKLVDAGLPVIVVDRALVGGKDSCYIAASPKQMGEAAGKWVADRLAGKGKIVELQGPVDSLESQEVHDGFKAALRDPGYRFVFSSRIAPPSTDAVQLMKDAMAGVDKFDVVFAPDDASALAAYQAAEKVGRAKDVLFVGIGGTSAEGAKYVSDGQLAATVLYPTGGAEAIDAAMKLLHGEQVPKKIVLSPRVLTKESR